MKEVLAIISSLVFVVMLGWWLILTLIILFDALIFTQPPTEEIRTAWVFLFGISIIFWLGNFCGWTIAKEVK